ncbi:MAG: hypothetical protein CW338_00140 [Clostridiales bacterium]|nr:hypothetical protein [Clostridiales bacterium]
MNCDIIQDLLPLYQDDVCSPTTKAAVEEHLNECADCRKLLTEMSGAGPEEELLAERQQVLQKQSGYFKRKGITAGMILAGILMIPVLVCLIVNIATGSGLGWFFIVLASLMVVASVSLVPVLAPEHKRLWTLGAFTACTLLLLLIICLYTGGNWFFVPASAFLFGMALIFLPFVVRNKDVSAFLGRFRVIAVAGADILLFILMMLCIGAGRGSGFFRTAGGICLPVLLTVILMTWLLGYVSKNAMTRRGFVLMLAGALYCFTLSFIQMFYGNGFVLPGFTPFRWDMVTTGDNLRWLALAAGLIAGTLMVIRGKMKEKRN